MSRQKDRSGSNNNNLPNEIKIPKPPKQPDKPLPAYMRYSRKVWDTVKTANPEMKMWDIGKMIGEQWRNLPEDERQGFFAEYEVEKLEYQDAMKAYHNSPAYREWLKAKEKAQNAIQEQQMMEKMIGTTMPKEEPRFQLQQMDEDDDDDDNTVKHIATARYQRNHKLIAEIFNSSSIPNNKSIVTRTRLENLKRQVTSLMQHQRKLESEMEDMEEKFEAKKRKILQSSEDFEKKLAEISKPPPPLEKKDISKEKEVASKVEETQQEEKEVTAGENLPVQENSLCGQLRLTMEKEKKQAEVEAVKTVENVATDAKIFSENELLSKPAKQSVSTDETTVTADLPTPPMDVKTEDSPTAPADETMMPANETRGELPKVVGDEKMVPADEKTKDVPSVTEDVPSATEDLAAAREDVSSATEDLATDECSTLTADSTLDSSASEQTPMEVN